jgi:predicted  nucleic acid-binding Zn-ribbon protein
MYDNQEFMNWLNKKSEQILLKVNNAKILDQDLIILMLKDCANRFEKIDKRFEKIEEQFKKVDERFEKVDERFEKIEKKIDDNFKWTIALILPIQIGILIKVLTQ